MVMTWIYLNLSFMTSSAYIGSEVKNARSLQLWSMPATLFIVGIGRAHHRAGSSTTPWATTSWRALGWADPTGLGFDPPRVHRAGLLREQQHLSSRS